ncbi:MAG: ATP-grasp domain-containing protein [Nitrospira sp.]|nr:ATP-grasp domain-containing protein [Nitrospira sp.]
MPSAIIVDAYSTGRHLAPLLAARGFHCHHVQSQPSVPCVFGAGCRAEDFGSQVVHTGNLDESAVVGLADRVRRLKPTTVVAGSEPAVPLADLLANELGLPCSEKDTAFARRDKYRMQRTLGSAGLEHIRTRLARGPEEARRAAEDLGFPVVVKPTLSAGAEDVAICVNEVEVKRAATAILGKSNALGIENRELVVQERLIGTEYIVNSVSLGGEHRIAELFRCQKVRRHDRILSAVEQLVPIASIEEVRVCEYALSVLNALGVREGPCHQELVFTERGACLVELAARMQGAVDPGALAVCTGTSHPHLTVEAIAEPERFLRRPVFPPPPLRRLARVIFLTRNQGTIVEIPGLRILEGLPSYFSHALAVGIGSEVAPTRDFVSAPGFVHLIHDSAKQLSDDYGMIRELEEKQLFFRTEPVDGMTKPQ